MKLKTLETLLLSLAKVQASHVKVRRLDATDIGSRLPDEPTPWRLSTPYGLCNEVVPRDGWPLTKSADVNPE